MSEPLDALPPDEATDSDELLNADGDEVVDPPEGWHGADKFGLTQQEAVQGESLEDKLDAERPEYDQAGAGQAPADESMYRVVR